jgi:ubiquitin-conjugating enzyme E2 M
MGGEATDLLPPTPQAPNPEDPLNKEAAQAFQENPRRFEGDVQRAITYGHVINGQHFPPCRA